MDNRTIKQNIAAFRKRLGMTQEQMAELIHISTTAYRDLEKGNTVILSEKIIDMAARTGFSVEEIARILRIPAGTVKSRLHQAFSFLLAEHKTKSW